MAKSREIVKRLKSVGNIRKITRTMEMISTARFQKAFSLQKGGKPYTEQIQNITSSLARSAGSVEHPLLRANPHSRKVIVLILTANRGLCGGYNSQILRAGLYQQLSLSKQGFTPELYVSGKKGIRYFQFLGKPASRKFTHFGENLDYSQAELLADELIEMYQQGQIHSVRIVYMKFHSMARSAPEILTLLPMAITPPDPKKIITRGAVRENYLLSPTAGELLGELIPTSVRANLYQCFTDALVSENAARMKAMKAATDNAVQMTKDLSIQYNRARQTQITTELMDIVGGAEALG